ncbi:MAG: restriction endonuclease subunit [Firmicutes bacterium]|nr:restriction endonuclease subunit [Bacillota bacterium]
MAKKKQSATAEELLEQALVPESEQPYAVPGNWVWVKLGDINKYSGKSVNPMYLQNSFFELYSVPSCEFDYPEILSGAEIGSSKQAVTKSDVLLCKINPRINRVWIVSKHTNHELIASSEWIVFRNNNLCSQYIKLYFMTKCFREYMLSNVSGVGGSLMRAQPKYVNSYPIPLPPLAEQQRIVDRIESLFAKLEQARGLSQEALDSFENRKAAILHKAFSGELTKKWREENGVGLDSWEEYTLEKVCLKITDGTHNSPPNYDKGEFMYITAKNIKESGIDLSNITYVSRYDFESIYARCNVEYGDVLYIKDGATTGIATINSLNEKFALLSSVALLKTNVSILNPKYLVWNLNSPNTKSKMISNMSGNAITRLTISKIKEAKIVLPILSEQEVIIKILDELFEKEQKAKELYNILDQIDLMKKSILARAFRGELGTNDPQDESALNLLKEVLEEKVG